MADEGFGTSIAFNSGFLAQILDVAIDGIGRKDIDSTHMLTPEGWMTNFPSDLKDPGTLTTQLQFDPDVPPPIASAAETITVTFPVPPGKSTGATWSCSGYLVELSGQVPHDNKMLATSKIRFSGKPTFTPSS
jgi:hypothetical protein